MKEIIKSEFVAAVNETKMTRKELAAKYELPETEIKKIMKAFGLKISRKQHVTYVIVDDTINTALLDSSEVAVDSTPMDIVPSMDTHTEAFTSIVETVN